MGLLLVGVFLVLVAAAYFIYFRFTKGKGAEEGEETPHKASELYKKSAEAERQKGAGYSGFQKKPAEDELRDAELNAELKALRSDWKSSGQQPPAPAPKKPEAPKELKIPTLRSPISPPKVFSGDAAKKNIANKLDKDFEEIERLEGELRSLKKNLKEK
jgi:hypothetical protein